MLTETWQGDYDQFSSEWISTATALNHLSQGLLDLVVV